MPKYRDWDYSDFEDRRERKGKVQRRKPQQDPDSYWDSQEQKAQKRNKKHPERR